MKLNEYNTSTSIYLEQMSNYIEMGEGYNTLRRHLFKQLHQLDGKHMVSDDNLADSIVTTLTNALTQSINFHRAQNTYRTLQIIEDLLTYTEEIMSPAMHNQLFISALYNTATPKLVTFNSNADSDNRNRALGIFSFWFDRYARDEDGRYELFINAYKQLRDKKIQFPNKVTINPTDVFKRQVNNQKANLQKNHNNPPEVNTNIVILNDIEDFTSKTELSQKQNMKNIVTTEYVRLIKHKSKVLYEFTSKPNDFSDKQKNKVKDLYKRLRTVLKEIDKYNESNIQTKKMKEQEQIYVQQKMTPKKSSSAKEDPKTDKKHPEKKVQEANQTPKKHPIDIDLLNDDAVKIPPKAEPSKSISSFDDLLNMLPAVKNPTPEKQLKKAVSSPAANINDNFDLLAGDVAQKVVEQEQEFVDGVLVDTEVPSQKAQPSSVSSDLFSIFANPQTPKKQKQAEDESNLLAKHSSNKSDSDPIYFDNDKKAKNPYSFIPDNLNLTPNSSMNDDDEERVKEDVGFNFFGLKKDDKVENNKNIYEVDKIKYDDSPKKKQKKESEQTPKKIVNVEVSSKVLFEEPTINTVPKHIEPVDYSKYAFQRSPMSNKSQQDEQYRLQLKLRSPQSREEELDLSIKMQSAQKGKLKDIEEE